MAIEHYGIRDVEHYAEKVNRYSSATPGNLARSGLAGTGGGLSEMMRRMWLAYEKHPGRCDGHARGCWIVAWLSGRYRWLAHAERSA